jgi:hypothetical protein
MRSLFDPEGLRESFERQRGSKATGVDGVRKEDYGKDLEARLEDLSPAACSARGSTAAVSAAR